MALTHASIAARHEQRARKGVDRILNRGDCAWLLGVLGDKNEWDFEALQQETGFGQHHINNAMQLLVGYGVARISANGFEITEKGEGLLAQLPPADTARTR